METIYLRQYVVKHVNGAKTRSEMCILLVEIIQGALKILKDLLEDLARILTKILKDLLISC